MRNRKRIPDNFSVIREGHITILAKNGHKEALLNLDRKLFDFSENDRDSNNLFVGRGRCLAITCNGMNGKIIIRRYHHGGLLGVLVGDLFWNQTRPLNELLISEKALSMGLRSAEVLAVVKHNILYPFYKAEIVTKEITDAFDLIHCIRDNASENSNLFKRKKTIIREIALAVQKMHKIGIYHGDLHLKNILLKDLHDGNFRVYIIDLDKSRLRRSISIATRIRNLYRLDRSVEKLAMLYKKQRGTHSGPFPVSIVDRVRFFKEYMKGYSENNKEWSKLIRGTSSSYRLHKLRWYFFNFFK